MFTLQRHCPERRPWVSSVWASHNPLSRAPTGSQSQAGSGVRVRTELGQRSPWRGRVGEVSWGWRLMFAGVRVTGIFLGVSVEEGPAELTAAPSCVVLTRITHTFVHVARSQVEGHVKVTAVGVPVALALWGRTRKEDVESGSPLASVAKTGRVWYLLRQAWGCPSSAGCHGWSWCRSPQRSQWAPAV